LGSEDFVLNEIFQWETEKIWICAYYLDLYFKFGQGSGSITVFFLAWFMLHTDRLQHIYMQTLAMDASRRGRAEQRAAPPPPNDVFLRWML